MSTVYIEKCESYEIAEISDRLDSIRHVFESTISPGDHVLLKPNWLAAQHKYDPNEWVSVITNPSVITAVLELVLQCLNGDGLVTITDAPQTDSQWDGIMSHMTPALWVDMGKKSGIEVAIVDLRLDEWTNRNDVTIARRRLPGDPRGSTICNLDESSEFLSHSPSPLGYYGADYDKAETNEAHQGGHHKYKVSRSAVEADVFINLPKLKTHKKAGITCSLKNLVGINTYKNWLPHHNEGTPDQGGDQFPSSNAKARSESYLIQKFKYLLNLLPSLGRIMIPAKSIGKKIFGDTQSTIRSGNWYGNDTLWRMVIDLNKVLLYAEPNGSLRDDKPSCRKKYISIVDGIVGGEGNGPEAPDQILSNALIVGTDPVSVDACCAKLMGFDWQKIPSIKNAFSIKRYRICDFRYDQITVSSGSLGSPKSLNDWTPAAECSAFTPHFGWVNHIEL